MNKKIILALITLIIIYSCSYSQVTYQKYDCLTRGVEYNLAKSQIRSNIKQIELLNYTKQKYSVFNDSKTRSQIRAVISAKENENFRLKQKSFLIINANKIEDPIKYNQELNKFRPSIQYSTR